MWSYCSENKFWCFALQNIRTGWRSTWTTKAHSCVRPYRLGPYQQKTECIVKSVNKLNKICIDNCGHAEMVCHDRISIWGRSVLIELSKADRLDDFNLGFSVYYLFVNLWLHLDIEHLFGDCFTPFSHVKTTYGVCASMVQFGVQ